MSSEGGTGGHSRSREGEGSLQMRLFDPEADEPA